ncbi:unnamed protein product [Amoebophrya sp. A25]|nr:unnamed protein product [Amoebophrya sp. A25]|eukprot:GSA25T00009128001.1
MRKANACSGDGSLRQDQQQNARSSSRSTPLNTRSNANIFAQEYITRSGPSQRLRSLPCLTSALNLHNCSLFLCTLQILQPASIILQRETTHYRILILVLKLIFGHPR